MDMTRLGVLAAILCVWHLSLPLNRGSQSYVLCYDYATDQMTCFDSWQGQEIFSSKCPHGLWGPPSLLLTGYWEVGGEVKFNLEQPWKAQRGSCDIAVLFL